MGGGGGGGGGAGISAFSVARAPSAVVSHFCFRYRPKPSSSKAKDTTATSALLDSVNARRYPAFQSKKSLLTHISTQAEEIMRHLHVFLTLAILKAYIDL
jgi:hypothetical protein